MHSIVNRNVSSAFPNECGRKKTEVSGVVYSLEFIPMAFFAISHVFFAIEEHQLSQLTMLFFRN